MKTYSIQGMASETFTIEATESVDHLPNSKAALVKSGKEPVLYIMRRYTEGTRKKSWTVRAWRFENTDRFITII